MVEVSLADSNGLVEVEGTVSVVTGHLLEQQRACVELLGDTVRRIYVCVLPA